MGQKKRDSKTPTPKKAVANKIRRSPRILLPTHVPAHEDASIGRSARSPSPRPHSLSSSDSESSYHSLSPVPCEPESRAWAESPDYDPTKEDAVGKMHRTNSSPPQRQASCESEPSAPSLKRKRGGRSKNRMPSGTHVITQVSDLGKPLQPQDTCAKFRNSCGFLVRDKLRITYHKWNNVPPELKLLLWNTLRRTFKYPEENNEDICQEYANKVFSKSLRRWRSDLNNKYVKKGLTPFKDYENISQDDWNDFVREKTKPQAIETSEKFKDLAQKNKYPSRLGPGGYDRKVLEWRRKEEEAEQAGKPNPLKGLNERSRNWLYARRNPTWTKDGDIEFKSTNAEEVNQKLLEIASMEADGSFETDRQNDGLTVALGNKEHSGRTRGVGSKVGWKHGFPDDADEYKTRKRYKKTLTDEIRAEVRAEFTKLWEGKREKERMMVEQSAIGSLDGFQSSVGSTHLDETRYAIDDLNEPAPCKLHVPLFSKHGKRRTVEAASGLFIPGPVCHNQEILSGYAKVRVDSVQPNFEEYELDIPTTKGGEHLKDVMDTMICWPKQDIILHCLMSLSPTLQAPA